MIGVTSTYTSKAYLKPCPFCGGEPNCGTELYSSGEPHYGDMKLKAFVRCQDRCTERSFVFYAAKTCGTVPFEDFADAFNKVVNLWNTRAEKDGKTDVDN